MSLSHLPSTKSSRPGHFRNIRTHLEGLQGEFELMAQEIESLTEERDQYKAEVEAHAKELEHVRSQIGCEHCQKTNASAPQLIAPKTTRIGTSLLSRFVSQSMPKTLQAVIPSRRTGGSVQPNILQEQLSPAIEPTRLSHSTSLFAETTITNSIPSPSSQLPSVAVGPTADDKEHDWSISFNDQVRKELDVDLAHTFFYEKIVSSVKFSHDGQFLAAGCRNGKAYIYDVQTGILICVLRNLLAKDDAFRAVCFSRDGKYLATASSDNYIYIWEIKTKYVRNVFKGHTSSAETLEFSPNGRLLLSASWDHTTRLWNMRCGAAKVFTTDDDDIIAGCPAAVFSPNGRYIAASSSAGQVLRIWVADTGQLIRKLTVDGDPAYDVAVMPDGSGLFCGGFGRTVTYWDISSLVDTRFPARPRMRHEYDSEVKRETRPDREFRGHTASIFSLAITTDGRWVASGSEDRSVRIWDTRTAAMQCTLNGSQEIYCVDFSPTGAFLASAGANRMLRIWGCSPNQGVSDTR